MTTHATPFGAAVAGGANQPAVAGEAISTSNKLMMVLVSAAILSSILIALFVMNIMWAATDKTEETNEADSSEDDDKKSSGTTKGAALRNYIGVVISTAMLAILVPGFKFANAM